MRILMLVTQSIAPDGITARVYSMGEEYEVGDALMPQFIAEALLSDDRARDITPKAEVHEEEVAEDAPEEDVSEEPPKHQQRRGRPPGPSEVK